MNEQNRAREQANQAARGKRPYASPKLTEYGSVAKLTQGSRTSQQDGGGGTTFKRTACL